MSTTHIEAHKNEIAKIVLMAGDPLRAKYYAENYLQDAKLVSKVRGMLAYTGEFNGLKVTIMGHGMGLDSIGIYSYELYKFYDVDIIIRIGSCGSYSSKIGLFDLIIVENAYTVSNYGKGYKYSKNTIKASTSLLNSAKKVVEKFSFVNNCHFTTVNSSMWFYDENPSFSIEEYVQKGIDVVEMESYALYVIAKFLNKKALTILTVSDNLETNEKLPSNIRETSFAEMFLLAIEILKVELGN